MKAIASVICVCFFSLNLAVAQSNEKISLPVLKENEKIDRLMDILSAPEMTSKLAEKSFSIDSCWIIELIDVKDYIAFQIIKNRKIGINKIVNRINTKKGSYGFFEYRGHEVLVWDWDTDSFYSLFSKTGEIGSIDFIYKIKNDAAILSKEVSHGPTFHYKYQNGQISVEEGPPLVGKLIK